MLNLMRKVEIADEHWRRLEPLLPPPRRGRGRPRADDRKTLRNPVRAAHRVSLGGHPPQVRLSHNLLAPLKGMGRKRYLGADLAPLLARLDEQGKLQWARAFLDGSFVPAKTGE